MERLLFPQIAALALPTAVKTDNAFISIVDESDNTDS